MIKTDNRLSLSTAGPGYLLQLWGMVGISHASNPRLPAEGIWPGVFFLGGTFLIVVGLGYGARAKGRAVWWAVIGVLPLIGIWIGALVINVLRDLTLPER